MEERKHSEAGTVALTSSRRRRDRHYFCFTGFARSRSGFGILKPPAVCTVSQLPLDCACLSSFVSQPLPSDVEQFGGFPCAFSEAHYRTYVSGPSTGCTGSLSASTRRTARAGVLRVDTVIQDPTLRIRLRYTWYLVK